MKKIFASIAFVAAVILSASCTKVELTPDIFQDAQEETATIYDLSLRFDAPADQTEAVVYFFDEHGQQVAVDNLSVPASSAEAVTCAFLSETRPAYLLTEGLQNTGDNGLLAIPNSTVKTRSGDDSLLLIIRH